MILYLFIILFLLFSLKGFVITSLDKLIFIKNDEKPKCITD